MRVIYKLSPIVLLLLLVFALFQGCSRGGESKSVKKIEPAPDFTLELFDGSSFRLGSHKGKPVLINFWASWCIPCREEAHRLEKAYKEFKDRVEFIGIAVQDTETKAREFVDRYGLTFPAGIDKKGDIKDAYRVYGIPTTFFIDGEGMISYLHVGVVTEELIRDELEKLL